MRGAGKEKTGKPKRQPKADTKDVLGAVAQAVRIDPKWQRHYDILMDLKNRFMSERHQLHQEALEEYTGPKRNDADVATNTYDRDWALGMLSSEQDALYEIDEALDRIRNGTYGKCELTGKPIPMERLNSIPWTRFTAEAERDMERQGQMERPKASLGERKSLAAEAQAKGPEESEEEPGGET